jgi:outer membrane receptor protein involved in Fe transport
VTQGIELDGEVTLARGLLLGGAYTYLYARDLEAKVPLLLRHRHQGHIRLAWESRERVGLRANIRGTFFSKWINTLASFNQTTGVFTPDVVPPGFALWDFYAAKRLHRNLEAFGAIDNFTNSRDPNFGSPLPIYRPEVGRTFRLGLRWSWAREKR